MIQEDDFSIHMFQLVFSNICAVQLLCFLATQVALHLSLGRVFDKRSFNACELVISSNFSDERQIILKHVKENLKGQWWLGAWLTPDLIIRFLKLSCI